MSFDVPAEAYDVFMGRFSAPLSAALADWAGIMAPATALDVGCGPGALTSTLAERLGADRVAAVDPEAGFVATARLRIPQADIRLGTAEDLPFADRTFDAALANLVVRLMRDPLRGVSEMRRVTRDGGTIAATVWDDVGERSPLTPFFRAYQETHPSWLLPRPLGTAPDELVELFADAGIGDVAGGELAVSSRFATFDDWWGVHVLGVGPPGDMLRRIDETGRARVRRAARAMLGDGPFVVDAVAWAARGLA